MTGTRIVIRSGLVNAQGNSSWTQLSSITRSISTSEFTLMSSNINLSQFAAFHAAATPSGKIGAARQVAEQLGAPYQPSRDFWKGGREAILGVVASGDDPEGLVGTGHKFHPKDPRG